MGFLGDKVPNGARRVVDFRSDTVTKPTAAMRRAMADAEVDDDILGVDPTMFKLQNQIAQLMGKEDSLFVPSGTMGNLIAVLVHCEVRGSEVILGDESHITVYEQGGISTLGGVHPRTVPNNADGTMDLQKLEAAIRYELDDHLPVTRLICLENTQARCGGRCISAEYTDPVGALAKSYGLQLHIDGACIFNASIIIGGVEYCHRNKVVYRNLKPENLLLHAKTQTLNPSVARKGTRGWRSGAQEAERRPRDSTRGKHCRLELNTQQGIQAGEHHLHRRWAELCKHPGRGALPASQLGSIAGITSGEHRQHSGKGTLPALQVESIASIVGGGASQAF